MTIGGLIGKGPLDLYKSAPEFLKAMHGLRLADLEAHGKSLAAAVANLEAQMIDEGADALSRANYNAEKLATRTEAALTERQELFKKGVEEAAAAADGKIVDLAGQLELAEIRASGRTRAVDAEVGALKRRLDDLRTALAEATATEASHSKLLGRELEELGRKVPKFENLDYKLDRALTQLHDAVEAQRAAAKEMANHRDRAEREAARSPRSPREKEGGSKANNDEAAVEEPAEEVVKPPAAVV